MPSKMTIAHALSVLEAHAQDYSGFVIDDHLARVAYSVSRGFLEGGLGPTFAEAVISAWEHFDRLASRIDEFPDCDCESVLGIDSIQIDAWGRHRLYLRAVVEADLSLSDPPLKEDGDE